MSKKRSWVIVDTRNFFWGGSLMRACTGSIGNVSGGANLGNIKVGQIFALSQNGSWALVDARNSLFLNFPQFDLFFLQKMIKIGFSPPVHALINDSPPKKLQASTGTHDPLFDNNKIWPTLIFLKFLLFGKSPKLPVQCPKSWLTKNISYRHQLGLMTLFFTKKKIWPTLLFLSFTPPKTFPKLPVHALINDPPEKSYRHQLGPMTHFLMTKHLTYFYISKVQGSKHISKASCACPN